MLWNTGENVGNHGPISNLTTYGVTPYNGSGDRKGEMKKTTIWLTDNEMAAVAREAKKTGLTQSEVIRRAIDEQILQKEYDARMVKRLDAKRKK